uniref:Uncharacterized protein n=1 Tax=uncultured prokaryote TaxID=198431 RepID=A0A0H5Q643_9ZZZZ|nr:hypothetical protein [uncultured prokaryote]
MVTLIRRVQTVWTGVGGTPFYTNLYYDAATGDVDDLVAATSTLWNSMGTQISQDLTFDIDPTVQLIDTELDTVISAAISTIRATAFGDSSDTPLPYATQGLMQFRTGVFNGGREIRGRCFIPGPGEGVNTAGEPTGTYLNLLTASGLAWLEDPLVVPVVWSKARGVAEPITQVTAWPRWAVLRSRRD